MQEVSDTGVFVFDDFPDPDLHPGGWMLHSNWLLFASHIPVLSALTGFSGVTAGEFSSFNFPNCNAIFSSTVTYSSTTSTIKANTGALHVYPNATSTDGSGTLYFHGAAHVFTKGITVNGPIAGSGLANVRLSADFTTTSAAAVDVTGLSFAIGANEVWTANVFLGLGCSTANGVKLAVTVPGGAVSVRLKVHGTRTNAGDFTSTIITGSGTLTGAFCTVASQGQWADATLVVENGATPGTVQIQAAAATGGDTASIKAGSFISARRLS